ncbi:hypothetical protein [Planococcus beigongshangi]|uniref:hypothetical protein n=1 Tax=Planococcus beigongshangi TaxID=2782536 RepID=UPI00193C7881|nr:hypothetical protein [Planococcus beigongshangi]
MTKTHYDKRIILPDYGELYEFYEVDEATRAKTPVDPFDAGLLMMALEELPGIFKSI